MVFRFLGVGGVCFALNLLVLWIGTHLLGWHYLLAALASLLLVNGLGFWLNRQWTFRAKGADAPAFWRSLGRYYIVSSGSFALNLLFMALLVELCHAPPLLASAVVGAILTAGNFVLHRGWSFGATTKQP